MRGSGEFIAERGKRLQKQTLKKEMVSRLLSFSTGSRTSFVGDLAGNTARQVIQVLNHYKFSK